MEDRYVIIMAGGIGSRFWPLSRSTKPKQFLDILGTGETLIQQTFNRFKTVCPANNIIIVTNDEYKRLVQEQLGIRPERILTEPFRRNTAPCIAYGTFRIRRENPNAVIAVTPADHFIGNISEFNSTINTCFDFANDNDALITLGIKPDKPETGYGYIRIVKDKKSGDNCKILKVREFTEKPDSNRAKQFILSGDYYWNSGIFIWNAQTILEALRRFLPDIWQAFNGLEAIFGTESEGSFVKNVYSAIQDISIDYGVLEKAENVYVSCADMGWSDIGTWSSLYDHSEKDEHKNTIIRGSAFTPDSKGNLISIKSGKVALLQGLENYIVVDTDDALLVIRKEEEQKIKQYIDKLR